MLIIFAALNFFPAVVALASYPQDAIKAAAVEHLAAALKMRSRNPIAELNSQPPIKHNLNILAHFTLQSAPAATSGSFASRFLHLRR